MKKIYIEPNTTVVALKVRDNVMNNNSIKDIVDAEGLGKGGEWSGDSEYNSNSRETVSAPDAWDEW